MAEQNLPQRISVTGEVISIKEMLSANFKDANGDSKFKHDTYLVRIDPLDGRPMMDVYITFAQFDKYGMSSVMFEGNIVNVSLDVHIANETTYINDDDEIEFDTKSYNAFAGADNVGKLGLIGVFARQGVAPNIVGDFIDTIMIERRKHKVSDKTETVAVESEELED